MYFLLLLAEVQGYYNYDQHGSNWPGPCSSSYFQSPIDINTKILNNFSSPDPGYFYVDLYYNSTHIINRNSTDSTPIFSGFNYNSGTSLSIYANFGKVFFSNSSAEYLAKKITFHYPAEHTINAQTSGVRNPLEIQIEHVNAENSSDALVISFLCQEGSLRSYFLDQVIESYQSYVGGRIDCTLANDGWFVIKNFWLYKGSETFPPCYEGVTWVVSMEVLSVTREQLEFFDRLLNNTGDFGNYRYGMPQYGRNVLAFTEEVFSQGPSLAVATLLFFCSY